MLILKFGGTSVGNADAFAQVASIVSQAHARDPRVVVVTSAMAGVTNQLIAAAKAAAEGDRQPYYQVKSDLLARHEMVSGQLLTDGRERAALSHILDERLREFERLCRSIAILGELTARGLDVVSGVGERLAAPTLAAVLRARGLQAEAVDAAELIVTDDTYGNANPLMEETTRKSYDRLMPMLERGLVPVVTGFVATTRSGVSTTLGRGGSDFSASILGAALRADEVQIWTDVDGILTADPRVVKNARSLPQLSYVEAAELAYFGAKVIHPKTVLPAVEMNIPVRVVNTFNPIHPGTVICREAASSNSVKALSAIKGLNLITVEGRGMMGVPGIAARTFTAVAGVKANVLMISQASSEQSICFVVNSTDAGAVVDALHHELHEELQRHYIDDINGQAGIVIIAVVGAEMRGTPGIAARIFGALGQANINVIAMAQGSSEVNISLVVAQGDADEAVRRIHDAFYLDQAE